MKENNFPPYFTTDYNVSNTWVNGVWYLRIWFNGISIADCLTEDEVYQKIEEHKNLVKSGSSKDLSF